MELPDIWVWEQEIREQQASLMEHQPDPYQEWVDRQLLKEINDDRYTSQDTDTQVEEEDIIRA